MTTPDDAPAPGHQEGDAADAIRNAEVALAHQNSTTAQVDLQVVTAVLNAHQKAAAGTQALHQTAARHRGRRGNAVGSGHTGRSS